MPSPTRSRQGLLGGPHSGVSAPGHGTPASIERRRSWAAAGLLPPKLACRFTLAEVAVLALIAAEVSRQGACTLTVGHLAAVAGVSETSVRNAVREAKAQGLVTVEEKRRT